MRLDGGVRVTTDALQVEFRGDPLAISWTDPRGRALAADRPTSAYFRSPRTGAVRHYLARERGERYYGLGDKTGPLDLHGRRLRTLALDSLGYDPEHGDPLYKHWPFVLTRTAQGGWYGIYYDTLAACTFDFGCEHDNYHGLYRYVEIDDGDLDYYLIAGASPAEVIARFVRLIGGTHLPPRWTLGYAQTAMGLTDAPDAQAQLSAFIDRCAQERVPVSAFHFGSGYSSRGPRRYVFTWNRDKFPDPARADGEVPRPRHAPRRQHQALPARRSPGLRRGARAERLRARRRVRRAGGRPVLGRRRRLPRLHRAGRGRLVAAGPRRAAARLRLRHRLERQQRVRRDGRRRAVPRLRRGAAAAPGAPAAGAADDPRQLRGAGAPPSRRGPVLGHPRRVPRHPALCADLVRRQHHQLGDAALEHPHRPADEPVGHVQRRPRRRRLRRSGAGSRSCSCAGCRPAASTRAW